MSTAVPKYAFVEGPFFVVPFCVHSSSPGLYSYTCTIPVLVFSFAYPNTTTVVSKLLDTDVRLVVVVIGKSVRPDSGASPVYGMYYTRTII